MLAIIGIAAVFLAVIGGFLLEHGNPWVLLQPAELLIVVGASIGIVMVANPPGLIGRMWRGALAAFRPPVRTPAVFL
jgi:chemotaxis protein MotA